MKYFCWNIDDGLEQDEVGQVYEGFEIASHGLCHENFRKISDDEAAGI